MSALSQILAWARTELPAWQSDAVRRILCKETFTDDDEFEIFTMLKQLEGLCDEADKRIVPIPIDVASISGGAIESEHITLKAIQDLENVNAIPNGATMPFAHEGLTVIYGENGSGKSGYARVLKRACRARDNERIYYNVFSDTPKSNASARFKVGVNGVDKVIDWSDTAQNNKILTDICVFDDKCALVILDENNEMAYIPYGAHVFSDLVLLMKRIRVKLEAERPKTSKLAFSDIPPGSKTGIFVAQLSAKTSDFSIQSETVWTKENELRLTKLKKMISDTEQIDPTPKIKRIRNMATRIKSLHQQIIGVQSELSLSEEEKLQKMFSCVQVAEAAVRQVSRESMDCEPLPGVGDDIWRILYEAARNYSLTVAYQDSDFPFTGDESRCVLCMQPLDVTARLRMIKFKAFMEDSTAQSLKVAQKTIKTYREPLINTMARANENLFLDVIEELRLRSEDLVVNIQSFFKAAQKKCSIMIGIIDLNKMEPIPALNLIDINDLQEMQDITEEMEKEALILEMTLAPGTLEGMKLEVFEMEARKALNAHGFEIADYVGKIRKSKLYERCIELTDTTKITVRGKTIISGALTPLLMSAMDEEIKLMGIRHLPLILNVSGTSGETQHQIGLKNCKIKEKFKVSDILSEGEQRVVALASFLAELAISENKCAIVFDDPVSSLDHRYREKIAERLVSESDKRQVIIFTHDLSFLMLVDAKAAASNAMLSTYTVKRNNSTPGHITDGLPWRGKKVNDRIDEMKAMLKTAEPLVDIDEEKYNREIAMLYGLLRETWEAFVEEVLFDGVVCRHTGEIHTQQLRSVSVTDDDYINIYNAMKKVSGLLVGHDKSKALDFNMPFPAEVKEDIDCIDKILKQIKNRNEKLAKERKKLVAPKESVEKG